jgi:hypothetical protein
MTVVTGYAPVNGVHIRWERRSRPELGAVVGRFL